MFNYKKYFEQIKPKTNMEIYNRFIFAITSIHTTWERNVIGYNLLKDSYHTDKTVIMALVKKAGLGLNNVRTKAIYQFTKKFTTNPEFYMKQDKESWKEYAKRLQKDIYGLGFAKTRFAIELIYPNKAQLVCVDTHVAQWAKQNPNKLNKRLYSRIEDGFINHSKNHKLNPVEARWKMWDKKQGYDNPRYWSYVLEK